MVRIPAISFFKAACTSEPWLRLACLTRCFAFSMSFSVVSMPASAEISSSSSSNHTASSMAGRSSRFVTRLNQVSRLGFRACLISIYLIPFNIHLATHPLYPPPFEREGEEYLEERHRLSSKNSLYIYSIVQFLCV